LNWRIVVGGAAYREIRSSWRWRKAVWRLDNQVRLDGFGDDLERVAG
jgi:hypothetical protein